MLAYNIKDILEIIPEAMPMVKKASLEDEFPTNNKDSVCASFLRIEYLTKVASTPVDEETITKIKKAADLYGVTEELYKLASAFDYTPPQEDPLEKLATDFYSNVDNMFSIEKTASLAEQLYREGCDDEIKRYSANAWLNKEAAVKSLANRYYASKDSSFVKVARLVIDNVKENDFDTLRKVCHTVTELDKKAGLDLIGFNFYKEALITKEAAFKQALSVTLAGETFPYDKIERFGKERIASVVGQDVAKEFGSDITNNKYMLESLPRDLQIMLKSSLKGI